MSLPLELAPLVFQFLPVKTLEKFPQDDPLLIAVLKMQDGSRPFRVTYFYFGRTLYHSVHYDEKFDLQEAFSKEVLLSLGVVHRVQFGWDVPDKFASMFSKNDTADDSFPFSRAEELEIPCKYWTCPTMDLSLFPKLRRLHLRDAHRGITISPTSRTMLLNYIRLPGGRSSVDGVCDISSDEDGCGSIIMNKDRCQRVIKISRACVDWNPFFDKSWCLSMELRKVSYSEHTLATLQGFSNLKNLKFIGATIELSQKWLPNIPLEASSFQSCDIEGTEFGSWPLVKELEFTFCLIEPFKGHFPKLESLIFHDTRGSSDGETHLDYDRPNSNPIAKEYLKRVKSFSLATKARRFDMSSFKELKDLEVHSSFHLTHLDCLNADILERVMIECRPNLKVDFPRHVSVQVTNVYPNVRYFPEYE